jgi:hypothetical protein
MELMYGINIFCYLESSSFGFFSYSQASHANIPTLEQNHLISVYDPNFSRLFQY